MVSAAAPPLRVLHVEDVPADAELAVRELRKAAFDFETRRVETREAFVAALKDFRPDVILSDYRLPEFDGMQALLLAKEHAPDVPVIITTGSVNEETAVACMRAGAADYVLKEQLGRLGTAVKSALQARRLRVEKDLADARILRLNRLFRTISEANQLIARGTDETSLLEGACRILTSHGGYALAWIGGVSPETLRVVPIASAGTETGYLDKVEIRCDDTPEGRGPTGTAIREGHPMIIPDIQADSRVSPWRDLMLHHGLRSDAAFPIRRGGAVTACLTVYSAEKAFFDGEEVALLEELANDLSFSLDALDDRERVRRAAEVLAKSEAYFRSILENSLDVTAVVDANGVVRYASPSVKGTFGFRPEEFVGQPVFDFIHPDDRTMAKSRLHEVLAAGAPQKAEIRCRHRDGSWRPLSVLGNRLPDETGMSGVVLNARDLTERLQLEAQFRQAQKMEAVGRLAGGVAHDFNNLLTVIQGYGELLSESLADDPENRESVGEIVKAAKRAAALTRQLLAFSRQQVLEMRVLDVGTVVADIERMLKRLIGEDIEVVVVKPATLDCVKADPGQIEQVLLNLAVNARDAMPEGGRLTIELSNVSLDAPLAATNDVIPPGRYVVIAMADTGTGMEAETLGHIFEPFFTTKEKGKGTGLGLATVYGIVRQSGGYVAVDTVPGAGTTFRIYVPRCDEPTTSGIRRAVGSRHGTETVLLVEDEPAVQALAAAILKRRGYTVLVAGSGSAALDVVVRDPRPIHLMLTDLVMPGMNGRELASRVRAVRPSIKVVFMSGYAADAAPDLAEVGASGFLPKPFSEKALATKVREVLDAGPV
jgi:two-component system cell cycle sensor histidine kinase/response regulator CckA